MSGKERGEKKAVGASRELPEQPRGIKIEWNYCHPPWKPSHSHTHTHTNTHSHSHVSRSSRIPRTGTGIPKSPWWDRDPGDGERSPGRGFGCLGRGLGCWEGDLGARGRDWGAGEGSHPPGDVSVQVRELDHPQRLPGPQHGHRGHHLQESRGHPRPPNPRTPKLGVRGHCGVPLTWPSPTHSEDGNLREESTGQGGQGGPAHGPAATGTPHGDSAWGQPGWGAAAPKRGGG